MDERIEPIRVRKDVILGNQYYWHKYKYLVEVKQKEKDICRVCIIKSSEDPREKNLLPVNHVTWVYIDDLRKK